MDKRRLMNIVKMTHSNKITAFSFVWLSIIIFRRFRKVQKIISSQKSDYFINGFKYFKNINSTLSNYKGNCSFSLTFATFQNNSVIFLGQKKSHNERKVDEELRLSLVDGYLNLYAMYEDQEILSKNTTQRYNDGKKYKIDIFSHRLKQFRLNVSDANDPNHKPSIESIITEGNGASSSDLFFHVKLWKYNIGDRNDKFYGYIYTTFIEDPTLSYNTHKELVSETIKTKLRVIINFIFSSYTNQ